MADGYSLFIDKKRVKVSRPVYYAYMRSEWRESKREKVRSFMEYSFDALSEQGMEFATNDGDFEELVEDRQLLESLLLALDELTDEERGLIDALYYQTQSERKVSDETGVPHQTIHKRKNAILEKLKRLLRI